MGFWSTVGNIAEIAAEGIKKELDKTRKYKELHQCKSDWELVKIYMDQRERNKFEAMAVGMLLKDRHGEGWPEIIRQYTQK